MLQGFFNGAKSPQGSETLKRLLKEGSQFKNVLPVRLYEEGVLLVAEWEGEVGCDS